VVKEFQYTEQDYLGEGEEDKMENLTNLKKTDFDQDTIAGFKKIINEGLSYSIFFDKDAIRNETDGKHISVRLFEDPPHMHETVLKLLRFYITKSGAKSVIGFTENDQALITIANQACYGLENMPFYPYDLENDPGADSQFVRPEVVPCLLLIPYSSNDIQVKETIERFTQQGPQIKQIISMVEECELKTDFEKMGVEYQKIADWKSIKNRIKCFKNLTSERMDQMMTFSSKRTSFTS